MTTSAHARVVTALIAPPVLTAIPMLAVIIASGVSLSLILAGPIVAAILVPPLALAPLRKFDSVVAVGTIVDTIGCIWLAAVVRHALSFPQWLQCYLVLLAFVAALWALTIALERMKLDRVFASALTIVVALLWLTWPIWLAPELNESLVSWLVPAHPIMALNGICFEALGVWSQQPVAYRLTSLGQDVPYALPHSIVPMILVHAAIAISFSVPVVLKRESSPE
jgi:hypothetical protein